MRDKVDSCVKQDAIHRLVDEYGSGIYSCVMDTYNYERAINDILPTARTKILDKGGLFVIRPDSGDILETVLMGLAAAEKIFGVTINKKGYKVLQHASIIQGDGVTVDNIETVIKKVMAAGYSAQNVAFGMGGGLLQVYFDTLEMDNSSGLTNVNISESIETPCPLRPKFARLKWRMAPREI